MDKLNREWCWTRQPESKDLLTEDEVAGLLCLNRRLSDLEHHLVDVAQDLKPRLEAKFADQNDRMADYEIDATLRFTLREDDAEFDDNQDNFLTVREEYLKRLGDCGLADDKEHCEPSLRDMVEFEGERHCWLFHDLYDHSYRLKAPRVPLHDCLRIGEVWVDVVIRQQYWLNIDTGEWLKFDNYAAAKENQ